MVSGFVCILDALGTKGIWNREEAGRYVDALKKAHTTLDQLKTLPSELVTVGAVFDYMAISDTLIITMTIDDRAMPSSPLAIIPAFCSVINDIFRLCFESSLFMRGAISYGKFIIDGSIIVGPAIDDAASFHEKPDMIGVVLTPNTTLLADAGFELNGILEKDRTKYLLKYPTPLKDNRNLELYQVNWPLTRSMKKGRKPVISEIAALKAKLGGNPIPAEAFSKYENTLKFYEYSLSVG